MDPDATLQAIRNQINELILLIDDGTPQELETAIWAVVEPFESLDIWLLVGGFLPLEWRHG